MKKPFASPPAIYQTAIAYASNEIKALSRGKAWIIMFLVPALLAGVLGPAVSGLEGAEASGRAVVGFAVMFSYMVVFWVGHAFYREYWYGTWVRQAVLKPPLVGFLLGEDVARDGIDALTTAGFLHDLDSHSAPPSSRRRPSVATRVHRFDRERGRIKFPFICNHQKLVHDVQLRISCSRVLRDARWVCGRLVEVTEVVSGSRLPHPALLGIERY